MTDPAGSEILTIAEILNDPELRSDAYGNSSGCFIRITHNRSGLSVTARFDEESVRRAVGELRVKVAAADPDERGLSVTAWTVCIAGLILAGAIFFAGGWALRGLRDRCRAEVARDRTWDEVA